MHIRQKLSVYSYEEEIMSKSIICRTVRMWAIVSLCVSNGAVLITAGPPVVLNIPSVYPGKAVGTASVRWIAPYVLVNEVTVSENRTAKAMWITESGEILKEINISDFDIRGGHIWNRKDDKLWIHILYDTSKIELTRDKLKQGASIYDRDFGKYLYITYSTDSGMYIDFYAKGSFRETYGPLCESFTKSFDVSSSGSIAYALIDSTVESQCKIISLDSLGEEIFTFESSGIMKSITASFTGDCVVLITSARFAKHEISEVSECVFSTGKTVRLNTGLVGYVIDWVPETLKMIVMVGETYKMIDWREGKVIWSVDDPIEYSPMTSFHGQPISPRFLLSAGLAIRESIAHGPVIPNELKGTIRMLAAIDIEKGELAAKWYEPVFSGRWQVSTHLPPMPNDGGTVLWYKDEFYQIADGRLSVINISDIENFENGWVPPTQSGRIYRDVGLGY